MNMSKTNDEATPPAAAPKVLTKEASEAYRRQAANAVAGEKFRKAVILAVGKCLQEALQDEPDLKDLPPFNPTNPAHARLRMEQIGIVTRGAISALEEALKNVSDLAQKAVPDDDTANPGEPAQ